MWIYVTIYIIRRSYLSAYVLLDLLSKLRKMNLLNELNKL